LRFVEWQLEAVSKMMAPPGRRSWPGARPSVTATTNAVLELAGHLTAERIEKATPGIDGLLADLVLPAGRGRAGCAAGPGPRRQAGPGPAEDKLDAVWLAKLTERGMLRPSFVPPAEIRALRDYTRLRTDLTRERTQHYARLEKPRSRCPRWPAS